MKHRSVESVLAARFISYTGPLELARKWLQSGDESARADATRLLEGLFQRYSHSIEIGHQLALSYLAMQDKVQAQRVIDQIESLCRNPHEEVLSRLGRMSRDEGDRYMAYPEIGGPVESPRDALACYRLAQRHYLNAWKIRNGHYPGINVASLYLLTASLDENPTSTAALRRRCTETAKEVVACRDSWPSEYAEDQVRHLATEGEAHLLQERWEEAANYYAAARQHDRFAPGHHQSMRRQMIRILHAFKRLGIDPPSPFDDVSRALSRA